MDWYLDRSDEDSAQRLRSELKDFLERHSTPDSDIEAALLGSWELIANGVRHAPGPVWVSLDWTEDQPVIEVHDVGPGFDLEEGLAKVPGEDGGFGLKLAYRLGEDLRASAKRGGGARVSARLPVYRLKGADQPYQATRPPAGVPVSLTKSMSGDVVREQFLLAVAVNLAQRIELRSGPDEATSLINEVGTQVGYEFERSYRRDEGIEGPLTNEQMADLFVELKAAIEGEFYVIEVEEDRIVLGNSKCPFGKVVQTAPSLCQMTSAVFGGIASRNRGNSRVRLDERIAVGDPGCRVVVEFSPVAKPRQS